MTLPMVDILILTFILLCSITAAVLGFFYIAIPHTAWLVVGALTYWGTPLLILAFDLGDLMIGAKRVFLHIGVFFLLFVIASWISYLLAGYLSRMHNGAFNRLLGFLAGAALGSCWILLIVFMLGFTAIPHAEWWQASQLIPFFQTGAEWLHQFLPSAIADYHYF